MNIQSGSIEARNVRDTEIEKHLRDFGINSDDSRDIIKFCGVSFDIPETTRNLSGDTSASSNGATTSGICTIVDSTTKDTKILIPIENAVQYPLKDGNEKDKDKAKADKEKEGIGE